MRTISPGGHSFKKTLFSMYAVVLAILLFPFIAMATGSRNFALAFAIGSLFLSFVAGKHLPGGVLGSGMSRLVGKYGRELPQRFESFESLTNAAAAGTLTSQNLMQTVATKPGIMQQFHPAIQAQIMDGDFKSAANMLSGGGGSLGNPLGAAQQVNGGPSQFMGGPLNNKTLTKATFQLNVSAPFVTTTTTATAPPISDTYILPIFGIKASMANYKLPGIFSGPEGYNGSAYNGAIVAMTTGVFPFPFAAVPVNPLAWYFAYTSTVAGITSGAMWAVTNNQKKMPYTMFLAGIFETYFAISRMRYILNNASQIQQFNYTFEKQNYESFGSGGYDTIDTNIYNSPEQLKTGTVDVDINANVGPSDLFLVGTDPTVITAGWSFGVFASDLSRRPQANQGAA